MRHPLLNLTTMSDSTKTCLALEYLQSPLFEGGGTLVLKNCIKATLVKIGANQGNSNTFAFKSRINFRQIMCHFKYYLAGCRIFCKDTLEIK